MKRNEKTAKIKVKPQRLTRTERKNAKRTQKAAEQLELCRQAGEFHKEYLAIELGIEEAKYEEIQARLAELKGASVEVTAKEDVEEAVETSALLSEDEFPETDGEEETVSE